MLFVVTWLCAAHGTWVYKHDGLDEKKIELLKTARKKIGLDTLYVSVSALPLDDPETPAKLRELKDAGFCVEALIDGHSPETWAERVSRFNHTHHTAFDGMHYDFEPWIGTGASTAWVDEAVAMYQRAKRDDLLLTVDVSGAKFSALSSAEQQRLVAAAPRIVLMQYETPEPRIIGRSEAAMQTKAVLVAVRVKDFGCEVQNVVRRLDAKERGNPRYLGWAIYEFDDYAKACLK